MLESLNSEGHLETVLAERVALLSWRLHRVIRYETESLALYQEKVEDDLARARRFDSRVLGREHPKDVRRDVEAARAKHRLLKRLPKLEADKRVSGLDADTVLWTMIEHTDRVAEAEVDPEDLLEEISIPGVPEDTEAWEDYGGWTAAAVRAGIEAIANATDEDPEELLEVATHAARRDIISKEQAAERVKQDLERMSRERLLPDEKTLGRGGPRSGPPLPRALQGPPRARSPTDETPGRLGSFGPPRRGRVGGKLKLPNEHSSSLAGSAPGCPQWRLRTDEAAGGRGLRPSLLSKPEFYPPPLHLVFGIWRRSCARR